MHYKFWNSLASGLLLQNNSTRKPVCELNLDLKFMWRISILQRKYPIAADVSIQKQWGPLSHFALGWRSTPWTYTIISELHTT